MKPVTRTLTLALFLVAAALLAPAPAEAQAPRTLGFQAFVTDGGTPVTDTLDLTFAVYDTSAGGTAFWNETIPNVPIDAGQVSVILGKVTPFPFWLEFDDAYWIALSIGANPEMTPRTELAASAYALGVAPGGAVTSLNGKTDDVTLQAGANISIVPSGNTLTIGATGGGGGDDGDWTINGSDMYTLIPGNVSINDTVPVAKFHVDGGTSNAGPWMNLEGGGSVFDNVALRLYDTGKASGNRLYLDWAHSDGTNPATTSRIYTRSYGSDASDGADFIFETSNDNTGGFHQNQLVLKRNGRVSIGGVGGPITALDVGGSIHAADSLLADHLELEDGSGNVTLQLTGEDPGPGVGPHLEMKNLGGNRTVFLDGNYGGSGAGLIMNDLNGDLRVLLESQDNGGGPGAKFRLYDSAGNSTISMDAEDNQEAGGAIALRNEFWDETLELNAQEGPSLSSALRLFRNNGNTAVEIEAVENEFVPNGGAIQLYNRDGTRTMTLRGSDGLDEGGEIVLYDSAGAQTLWIDADRGGSSRIEVDVLELNGADLSETFDVTDDERDIEPGMVVSIDPNAPGDLRVSSSAYDRTVAGIVSGAGGVRTGLLMGQDGTEAHGEHPVALTGRVYCFVDATNGPIVPGDLLTTSDVPGHAMKVDDPAQAQGAILGKAMTGLASGQGMVLVLVSLQ